MIRVPSSISRTTASVTMMMMTLLISWMVITRVLMWLQFWLRIAKALSKPGWQNGIVIEDWETCRVLQRSRLRLFLLFCLWYCHWGFSFATHWETCPALIKWIPIKWKIILNCHWVFSFATHWETCPALRRSRRRPGSVDKSPRTGFCWKTTH